MAVGASGCADNEYSAGIERIGVLCSADHGATWRFLGHACFHAPALTPVDPSPLAIDGGGVALHFLDINALGEPASVPRVIYRAESTDGLRFGAPVPSYSQSSDMTDPYVLRAPQGFRMYTGDRPELGSQTLRHGGAKKPPCRAGVLAGGRQWYHKRCVSPVGCMESMRLAGLWP